MHRNVPWIIFKDRDISRITKKELLAMVLSNDHDNCKTQERGLAITKCDKM